MNNFYQQVHGWFDYEDAYKSFADALPENGTFVEVGVWAGKSIIFMASYLTHINKKANIYAVDTWQGTPDEAEHKGLIEELGGDLYEHFADNVKKAGLQGQMISVRLPSVTAAQLFGDQSIDLLFLDADHSYEGVSADIKAWKDKVKRTIAGHDLDHLPVERAVREHFPEFKEEKGHVWYYDRR